MPRAGPEVCNVFSYLTPPDPERMQVLAQGPPFHESNPQEYESYQWEALRVWPLKVPQSFIRDGREFDIIEWYQPQGVWDAGQGFEPDPEQAVGVVTVLKRSAPRQSLAPTCPIPGHCSYLKLTFTFAR